MILPAPRVTHTIAGLLAFFAIPALAAPAYVPGSGTGAVSFGVTGFNNFVPPAPTYILNNFTGQVSIMTSPGNPIQTSLPTVPNNIREVGPFALPGAAFQVGGFNLNGPFGSGSVGVSPTTFGFQVSDFAPEGGSGSYLVASSIATFNEAAGYAGAFGSWLAIGGTLPAVGSDVAASLRTFIDSANPASPFFGGFDLPELVMAIGRIGPVLYAHTERGGAGLGGGAVMVIDDPLAGAYRGLALNNFNIAIPAGDVFVVKSTLTVIADPSTIGSNVNFDDLVAQTGSSLPAYTLVSSIAAPVPEVDALWMLLAGLGIVGIATRRRRSSRQIS